MPAAELTIVPGMSLSAEVAFFDKNRGADDDGVVRVVRLGVDFRARYARLGRTSALLQTRHKGAATAGTAAANACRVVDRSE